MTANNTNANFEGPVPSCELYPSSSIWFEFVAPSTGGVKFNIDADFPNTLTVYSGDCNNLEEIRCFNNPLYCQGYIEVGGLIQGQTYYIRVSSQETSLGVLEGEL